MHPYCATNLGRAGLVAPGVGWAIVHEAVAQHPNDSGCTTPHLYWTETNGQSWREISPAHMPARDDPFVFFLDRSHGWVLSPERLEGEDEPQSYLLSTDDAGNTWRSIPLKWPRMRDVESTYAKQVFFVDPTHGWILWEWHMMHGYQHALLATEDGGATWKRLSDPPGSGQLQFISPRDGWMIGEPQNTVGIPVPQSDSLWATQDGGVHWRALNVSFPAAPDIQDSEPSPPYFTAFRFRDALHGLAVAQRQISGYVFQVFTCTTDDGGQSWRISSFEAYHASPSFVGGQIIWSISDWPDHGLTLRSGEHVTSPALEDGAPLHGRLSDVGFLDASNGWTTYGHDERSDLVATTDAGTTFSIISPPVLAQAPLPPPEISAVNGQTTFKFAGPISRTPPPVAAGGVLLLMGIGFLPDNAVRMGDRTLHVASENGRILQFLVPVDLPYGIQQVVVENVRGTSNTVQVLIGPPVRLRLSHFCDGEGRYLQNPSFHAGEKASVLGYGFLQDNTVWFGTAGVPARLSLSSSGHYYQLAGDRALHFVVPVTLEPGSYDVYVTNASGKSDVIQVRVE